MKKKLEKYIAFVMIAVVLFSNSAIIVNAETVVLDETFESVSGIPSGWTQSGSAVWGTFATGGDPGNVLYGDIVNYPYVANITSILTSPSFNLSGATNATLSFDTRCDTRYDAPATSDRMMIETSGDGSTYSELARWNEMSIDDDADLGNIATKSFSLPIPSGNLTSDFKLRLSWITTDGPIDGAYDGCYIDNLKISADGTISGGGGGGTIEDTVAPVVNITSPTSNQELTTSDVSVEVTSNESASCQATLDSSTTQSMGTGTSHSTTFSSVTNGSHSVSISCADSAGNSSTPASVSFTVNSTTTGGGDTGGGGGSTGSSLFSENFNSTGNGQIPPNWSETGSETWGAYSDNGNGLMYGDYSNYPYLNDITSSLITPTIDLTSATDATVTFKTRCDTEYSSPSSGDYMSLEFSKDNATFTEMERWNEQSIDTDASGEGFAEGTITKTIPGDYLTSGFKMLFRWSSNSSVVSGDGCYIDDVVITGQSASGGGGGGTGGGSGTISGTQISACGTLASADTTYEVASAFTGAGTCLNVTANGVTIDGKGYTLSGPGSTSGTGIYAQGVTGLTVKNLDISSFEKGIEVTGGTGATIENSSVVESHYGIILRNQSGALVTGNSLTDNLFSAIYLENVSGSTLSGNIALRNDIGISLVGGSQNTLSGNTAQETDRGIILTDSSNNTLSGNTTSNSYSGLAFEGNSTGNIVSSHTSNLNTHGIAIASPDNTITSGTISGSSEIGLRFFEEISGGNNIQNLVISDTTFSGLDISFDSAGSNFTRAIVDGTKLQNVAFSSFNIPEPGGTLTYENTNGVVAFTEAVSGSGNISDYVTITPRKISIASGGGFDSSANLTFKNIPLGQTGYEVIRNGEPCPNSICTGISGLGQSTVTLAVTGGGNYEVAFTGSELSDSTSPVITISSPISGQTYTTSSIDSNISTNELATCSVALDAGAGVSMTAGSSNTFSKTFEAIANGSHTLAFTCEDMAGNTSASSVTFTVNVASSAGGGGAGGAGGTPATVFSETFESWPDNSLPTGWTESNMNTFGTYQSDLGGILYGDIENFDPYADNNLSSAITPSINLSGATSAEVKFKTRCDTEYNPVAGGDYMALETVIGGTLGELGRWNEQSIDTDTDPEGAVEKQMTFTLPQSALVDGLKLKFIWATNGSLGSADGCYIDDLTVTSIGAEAPLDTTAPIVTVSTPSEGVISIASSITVNATTNETSVCKVKLDAGANQDMTANGNSHTKTLTGLTGGAHSIAVFCTDTAGNSSAPITRNIQVSIPPTIGNVQILQPVTKEPLTAVVTNHGYTLKWDSNQSTFNIYLADSTGAKVGDIALNTAGTNFGNLIPSYNWVPSNSLSAGTYAIVISVASNDSVRATSTPFVLSKDASIITVTPGTVSGEVPTVLPTAVVAINSQSSGAFLLSPESGVKTFVKMASLLEDVPLMFSVTPQGDLSKTVFPGPMELHATTTQGAIEISIASGTAMTASSTWNGLFLSPKGITSGLSLPSSVGTVKSAIHVGLQDATLAFDKAVKLILRGKGGTKAGFVGGNGQFVSIDAVCTQSEDLEMSLSTPECAITSGSDLVIWTKHFSTFISYESPAEQALASNSSANNSGGGGGGGGGGGNGPIMLTGAQSQSISTLLGDISADGVIDLQDFNILMVALGNIGVNIRADLNSDGTVDILDINILMTLLK